MTESGELILVISTVESSDDAERVARELIDRSLAACVQIDGPIVSHYRWAGKLESTREFRLMIKSSNDCLPQLRDTLAKIHPYDEPEIVRLPITDATPGYRDWVIDQTT